MKLWLATAVFALTAVPALAEKADRTKPLNYEADTGECDDLKQVCVLVGNVVLNKGTMRAVGERVQVRKDPEGYQYGVIVAAPGKLASFRQRRDSSKPGLEEFVEGYAERIEYDEKEDTVKLTTRARSPARKRGSARRAARRCNHLRSAQRQILRNWRQAFGGSQQSRWARARHYRTAP